MPERNIVVQPRNRGTGIGVTLPLLRILSRDPEARIVLLPSDHYVADEDVLERAVREALAEVGRRPQRIVLLGIVPDDSDGDFGWVVPADPGEPGIQRVAEFVEKPPAQAAAELIARGALWNSFILVAEAKTLLELFDDRLPGVVTSLWGALARSPRPESAGDPLAEVYERLDAVDFSREVLENCVERLSVLPVPPCGWCDLGTPVRVARCVDRLAPDAPETPRIPAASDVFDLGQASRLRGYVTGAGLPTPTPDAKTPPRQRRDGVFERNL